MKSTVYKYRATDSKGNLVAGVINAGSERAVLDELRRKKLYAVAIEPERARKHAVNRPQAVALYARTLANIVGAGLPLEQALAFAAQQSTNDDVRQAGHNVRTAVAEGATLSDAMRANPLFGPVMTAMVMAGEESGALDESLDQLADHLDEMIELRNQIRSALLYPALVAGVSVIAIALLLLFVIPRFGAMLQDEGAQLPLTTRLLVAVSTAVAHWWWALLLIVAVMVVRWRKSPPRLPLWSRIEAEFSVAVFARTLGMLLRSGRPLIAGMQTARATVSSAALGAKLELATDAIAGGSTVRAALNDVLPPLATEMLAVGEESGRLDEMCLRVADVFETNVRRSLRSAVALLEPALIVIMAGVVGFVALAMLQAIYSINRSMF